MRRSWLKLSIHFCLVILIFTSEALWAKRSSRSLDERKSIEVQIYWDIKPNEKVFIGQENYLKMELSEKIPVHFFQLLLKDRFLFKSSLYILSVNPAHLTGQRATQSFQAKAVFVKPLVPKLIDEINISEISLRLKLVNMEIEVFDDPALSRQKKPVVLDQNLHESPSRIWFWLLLLVVGVTGFFGIEKYIRKRRSSRLIESEYLKWKRLISEANSRHELEKIWISQQEWTHYFAGDNKKKHLFLDAINKIQFKESWSFDELDTIKNYRDSYLQTINQNPRPFLREGM